MPMIMVMLQPDLGTALTYLPILAAGVFLAGLRWQYAVASCDCRDRAAGRLLFCIEGLSEG